MNIYNAYSFLGVFFLMATAWILSKDRSKVNIRLIFWGLFIQFAFAAFIFIFPFGSKLFLVINDMVVTLLDVAGAGTRFIFGVLSIPVGEPGSLGLILITQALPSVIFFTALMELLYFYRIMPRVINAFSHTFTKLFKISGAESLSVSANIFVGVEAVAAVRPYLAKLTPSELCTVLTAGLATIASSMLGFYVLVLNKQLPHIAGHLVAASIMAAPAAIIMSKLLYPENGTPETLGKNVDADLDQADTGLDALIRGASNGGKLVFGIVTVVIALLGLLALLNFALDGFAIPLSWFHISVSLRLEHLLGYLFYPFALMIGVPPHDAVMVAQLLGERLILTEVVAYQHLAQLMDSGALDARSAVLASYALCGFTHIASLGIFSGGLAILAPNQTKTLAEVGLRSLIAATLATLMVAAIAGTFYGHATFILNS